jgi:hypothetical protein
MNNALFVALFFYRNLVMKNIRMSDNWRLAAILIPGAILLYVLFNFLVVPRFETWIMAQIPGSTAVKNALETQFPQDKVSISSNTNYGSGGNNGQRTLTIGEAGKSFLTSSQLAKAKSVVCSSLGQNAKKYNNIYIQNTVEHQFLFFYSARSQGQPIKCQ